MAESFEPKRFDGQWISENKFAYLNEYNNIMLFNCDGLNSTTVISNLTIVILIGINLCLFLADFFERFTFIIINFKEPLVGNHFKFTMTSDPNVILIAYDHININRHSFTARYKLYNTISNM